MKKSYLLLFWVPVLLSCTSPQPKEFTVLQWNIWQEGTMVPGGYDAIVNEIVRLRPDFVTLSEVRNYQHTNFTARLVASLEARGETYYSFYSTDTGLLSRSPITDSLVVFPEHNDHGSIHRLTTEMNGKKLAVYTAHLDYLDDAYYNVRGYDGSTWEEIPVPETVEEVLERNVRSQRDDAIACFLRQAEKDRAAGCIVILGGDFNEPSHRDWTEETKNLYDHHGFVIPWTVSVMLEEAGYVDAYRSYYPDVLNYPGFTFPSDNPAKEAEILTWAPKSDERDRIDYIWFYPEKGLKVKDTTVFGPRGSIIRGQRMQETSQDPFLEPIEVWPTDHKGVLVTFQWSDTDK